MKGRITDEAALALPRNQVLWDELDSGFGVRRQREIAVFIPDGAKKSEYELAKQFLKAWPKLLGALFDGVVAGLSSADRPHKYDVGRMTDMIQFVTRCERAFWKRPKFVAAYAASNFRGAETLVEADPVTSAIVAYLDVKEHFLGTASELLIALKGTVASQLVGTRLPGGPSPLSEALTRAEPVLGRLGIIVTRDRVGSGGARVIEIKRLEPRLLTSKAKGGSAAKASSSLQPSAQLSFVLGGSADGTDGK